MLGRGEMEMESTLSHENLFIERAFAEYFSRLLSNIQSEQSRAEQSSVPGSGQPVFK